MRALTVNSGVNLPSQMSLKAWKPGQDLRMVRRRAFHLAKEFKLKPGECVVVTNAKWSAESSRKWCLVVQTAELIPLVCYVPTVHVKLVDKLTLSLHDFLKLWAQSRKRGR
jgi:hypothetical protein